jgi:CO dehydrogenase maturation factor
MSYAIAITGKGGTGKTTVAGLLVSALLKHGCVPVLAVDADPNSCLDGVLGVKAVKTVGGVREEVRDEASKNASSGIAKREWLELKISESLVEADGFDLIAMGRPEGPGCYCFANNVLRDVINEIARNYPYIVIDNEAGLENLSRRIVQKVDLLVMVGDPSKRGLDTVKRLYDLAREMKMEYGKLAIVVNRTRNEISRPVLDELMSYTGADFLLNLQEDPELSEIAERGDDIRGLSHGNPVFVKISEFLSSLVKCK